MSRFAPARAATRPSVDRGTAGNPLSNSFHRNGKRPRRDLRRAARDDLFAVRGNEVIERHMRSPSPGGEMQRLLLWRASSRFNDHTRRGGGGESSADAGRAPRRLQSTSLGQSSAAICTKQHRSNCSPGGMCACEQRYPATPPTLTEGRTRRQAGLQPGGRQSCSPPQSSSSLEGKRMSGENSAVFRNLLNARRRRRGRR